MVMTSCALLKLSLSTSNVFDGATRVKNKSSPYANTSDVDSSSAGDVITFRILATWVYRWGGWLSAPGIAMWDGWTYLVLVREDPLGVVREHCVVLDEPLLRLLSSRLVFWTSWVEEPARE